MINPFFTKPAIRPCLHVGPLGSYIDGFAALLSERGYTKPSVTKRNLLVAKFNRWLRRRKIKINELNEHKVNRFLRQQITKDHVRSGNAATLRMLLQYLRERGIISTPTPKIDNSALKYIEHAYVQYLIQERRLAQSTLSTYLRWGRRFLSKRFGTSPIRLKKLRLPDITRFILRYMHTVSCSEAKSMVAALRSFLRFLYLRGDIATDLATAIPAIANRRFATLPEFLSAKQVERILQSCDQNTIIGQRNYAILLLLARLGLRAGEVVAMTLDDINWESGTLIIRGKGSRQDRLPLPQDVGKTLATYLCNGRPYCSTRRVFVCMRAPRRAFASSVAISTLVRRAIERAGLHPKHKGAHLLRHSLATQMLNSGSSLAEIGEILRHCHLNTTQIYAKVDLAGLRTITQPWLGGER